MSEAPRVTEQELDESIANVSFTLLPDGRTTICQLTLYNGYTVHGESACVSIENYNEQQGQDIAYKKARDKLWPLLGFRLADYLWRELDKAEPEPVNPVTVLYPEITPSHPNAPYVGQSVAYVEMVEDRAYPPMAAFVAGHNEDGTVNLSVLAPNGTQHVRQQVRFHHADEPNRPENHARYW